MTLPANLDRLVETRVAGEVTNPYLPESVYRVDRTGEAYVPVGSGGVHYNVRVGMGVSAFAADQVQPGVSIANPVAAANQALSTFACVGNSARVTTGAAKGAVGVVTGRHEEFSCFQHVLVDFEDEALRVLCPGDQVVVHALGVGLRPDSLAEVDCHSMSPDLWMALPLQLSRSGALRFPVAAVLPPQMVGIGSGRVSATTSLCLQVGSNEGRVVGEDPAELRIGDLVAIADWDARYHTGYRPGSVLVAVVTTGSSRWPGHGPSLTILASGRQQMLVPEVVGGINIAELLGIGTGRRG